MRGIDLTNQRFANLTAIKRDHQRSASRTWVWLCRCDCGALTTVDVGQLRSGTVKSCGCQRGREVKHGMHNTPTYYSWKSMKARCDNPKSPDFKYYGALGVGYPEKWKTFEGFYADMGERPEGKTLDRKDFRRGYSKANCRWATPKEQANNRRPQGTITVRRENDISEVIG